MIRKFYATLFSLLILFMAISPSLKLMLDDAVKITVEINLEEESKEKESKVLEFNLNRAASSSSEMFKFEDKNLNIYNVKNYNSHYIELHSPPPERVV